MNTESIEKKINNEIQHHKFLLIKPNGERLQNISRQKALQIADDYGLDLVLMAETPTPVCKILDYPKYLYEQKKKLKKKKQTKTTTKQLQYKPNTNLNDIERLIRKAQAFINQGHNVKFVVLFKGREIAFLDKVFDSFHMIKEKLSVPCNYTVKADSIINNNKLSLYIQK